MRTFAAVLLIFVSGFISAQVAIIRDNDGYCYVRSSAEKKNNSIDTLQNGRLVYCFEPEGNWIAIDYTSSKWPSYVYKDRVKFLSSYSSIPVRSTDTTKSILEKDSIRIVAVQKRFDRKKNKLTFSKQYPDQLEKVNGKPFWGTDGGIPHHAYYYIAVKIGKREISIPRQELDNLFEPNLSHIEAHYDVQQDILYIESMNSDGAGGYIAVWKIEKGVYRERLIVHGF